MMFSCHHFLSLLSLLLLLTLQYTSLSSAKRCHPDDERALLEIKAYFNNASAFSTWTPQTPCCRNWSLVSCKRLNNSKIFRVNSLEINGLYKISGEIPSVLEDLPYLETLILEGQPNLTGPIPPAIGKLTQLQVLILAWNNHTGSIPPFLSRLTNLSYLALNNNRLTGRIPPFLGRLPKLSTIYLYENQLMGPIPDTFGLLPNNTQLKLYNNKLSGTIPRSLGRVNFKIVDLSGNQLTGDASFLLGEDKTDLNNLILARNKLSFNLSKTVFPTNYFVATLLEFDLSHNMIYGGIPSWLGLSSVLFQFDVSYNRLCGPIPTDGGQLQTFAASAFSNNKCLCGAPLPPCN